MLNKDQILSQTKLPMERVEAFGGEVCVRALTGAERDAFEAGCVVQRGKKTERNMANLRARLVVLALCDEDGKRIFADSDAEAVGKLNASDLDKVFGVASRLSGLTEKDQEELLGN